MIKILPRSVIQTDVFLKTFGFQSEKISVRNSINRRKIAIINNKGLVAVISVVIK